jgi:hypothetical protein
MQQHHLLQLRGRPEVPDLHRVFPCPDGIGRSELHVETHIADLPREAGRRIEPGRRKRRVVVCDEEVMVEVRREHMAHRAELREALSKRRCQSDRRMHHQRTAGQPHHGHPGSDVGSEDGERLVKRPRGPRWARRSPSHGGQPSASRRRQHGRESHHGFRAALTIGSRTRRRTRPGCPRRSGIDSSSVTWCTRMRASPPGSRDNVVWVAQSVSFARMPSAPTGVSVAPPKSTGPTNQPRSRRSPAALKCTRLAYAPLGEPRVTADW